ncbi:hypothetical protein [Chryseobacterium rhizosphaerae]|uniref:Ig-like domain-containing protein n=1 Tax=Chryseobacterium rhizosphaerae TaxID=395937 RepID=A0ABX9IS09_9FLAO|nr:hypothetical protein [Chryseobacterium rhizosphaerae]REC78250.1 hypothetical protein DRF57_02110 [Chryseobacterium rhizosphaerae]GEN66534.1 hypothetical protein CRH01_11020 [Chryseobacterium rhizosphaerae]
MMKTKFTTPRIKVLLLALLLLFGKFYSQTHNGAVGINTTAPNANSVLDVVSGNNNKGMLIPRLTEAQRDAIIINKPTDDGLTIYNTTEDCFNYWSLTDNEWKSVCGQLGKAVFTIDCSSSKAMGSYVKGKELTNSHYLSISVNVTKLGNYTVSGTTSNGYNFYGTGVFLNTGIQTIQVLGQGTPQNIQTDTVALNANGTDVNCTPPISISVLSPAGTYTMACGSATVNGVYKVGTALTASNTITLPVNVSALGSYTITTNTVDGISFKGSGTFTATGNQNITLGGTGTPTSTSVKTITITSDSQGGVSTTCSVNVIVVIPKKNILHLGLETAYGYSAYTGPSRSLMDSPTNFGTTASSIVKYEGFNHISLGNSPSSTALQTALNNKPDIVIIGYNYTPNATDAGYIASYLNKKGVVIALTDDTASAQNLFRGIFSDPTISTAYGAGAGSVYALANSDDPILNGPFGDVRGKNWGEDASTTVSVSGLTSGFTPYSYAQPINSTTSRTGISGLRNTSLNFIWFGDGGFLSNENANGNQYSSNTIEPFVAPSSGGYFPVQKSAYGYAGNGYSTGGMQVQNSILFANMIAWAIKQAEFSGINTQ